MFCHDSDSLLHWRFDVVTSRRIWHVNAIAWQPTIFSLFHTKHVQHTKKYNNCTYIIEINMILVYHIVQSCAKNGAHPLFDCSTHHTARHKYFIRTLVCVFCECMCVFGQRASSPFAYAKSLANINRRAEHRASSRPKNHRDHSSFFCGTFFFVARIPR